MIKILAKNYSQAVNSLCEKLQSDNVGYDVLVSQKESTSRKFLQEGVKGRCLILVGNVGDYATLFADTFGLTMFYDKFAEKCVAEYCKLAKISMPAQHVLDKICYLPEMFNHYSAVYGYQCACFGEYNKAHVYILPDDAKECEVIYDNYLSKDLMKEQAGLRRQVLKVFGFPKHEVEKRLANLNKAVLRSCETDNLDSKITLVFPPKCPKSLVEQTLQQLNLAFGVAIYAHADQTLAKTAVQLLSQVGLTISTAESITGGMIASSIVDIVGSSAVFYEGAVTYSSIAKSKRLGISPHFIDQYGAVSPNVAKAMAEGLLQNGSDIAIATTGYAGPDTDGNSPVGLCYIAVGTHNGVAVHKNVFVGDRNSIRAQATNAALYLAIKSITK